MYPKLLSLSIPRETARRTIRQPKSSFNRTPLHLGNLILSEAQRTGFLAEDFNPSFRESIAPLSLKYHEGYPEKEMIGESTEREEQSSKGISTVVKLSSFQEIPTQ